MDLIIKLLNAPEKDKYGYYGKYDFFTVLMTNNALGAHEVCLSPKKYEVQLLKEKLVTEYKVPEELVDKIVESTEDYAVSEYCKSISKDI
jgi:hypothetical protein